MTFRSIPHAVYRDHLLENETIWRHLLNRHAVAAFRKAPPVLENETRRVVADLNRFGAARTTLEALTGDATLLGKLQRLASDLEPGRSSDIERKTCRLAGDGELSSGEFDKEFLVTLLDAHRPVIQPDGLLASVVLSPQVKGVADSYFGLRTVVSDLNYWMNLPSSHAPAASQLWHRDLPEDHFIFKMFVYIEDVTDECGPFSYVTRTHRKGDRFAWNPKAHWDGFNWRATDDDVCDAGGAQDALSFAAPAGTVLFADTKGWHKGGKATGRRRLVLQTTFSSPAALRDRKLGFPADADRTKAPAELRYDWSAQPSYLATDAVERLDSAV